MLTIHLDSPMPITEQIFLGIRRLIACGELRPGDDLPTVRQLAADLGVNQNTVARGYRALEDAGLVSTVRGRGTEVTAAAETARGTPKEIRQRIAGRLRDALADLKLAGLARPAAEQLIADLLDEFLEGRCRPEGVIAMFWFDLLFPPAMIVAPLLMTFIFRRPPAVPVDQNRLRRLNLQLGLWTALGLAVFAGVYIAAGPEIARHCWPLSGLAFFGAMRLLPVKCPHLVVYSQNQPTRTASLVNRTRQAAVPGSWNWTLWGIWTAATLAVALRAIMPLDQAELFRWLLCLGGAGLLAINPLVIPLAVRRCMEEPEPLDAAAAVELQREYAALRRFRAWGLFALGLTMSALLGGVIVMMAWLPQDPWMGAWLGGVGGGLGAAVGIGGAIFGTMASIRRARIAAKLHALQTRAEA